MRREELAPVPTPVRWWRLGPWSRNHLMRPSDRYEATIILIILLTAAVVLLLIPVAAAFGTSTQTRLEQQTHTLRAGVRPVPAVLLEDTYLAPHTPEYSIRPAGTQNTARRAGPHPMGITSPPWSPTHPRRLVRPSPSASTPTATSPAPSPTAGKIQSSR